MGSGRGKKLSKVDILSRGEVMRQLPVYDESLAKNEILIQRRFMIKKLPELFTGDNAELYKLSQELSVDNGVRGRLVYQVPSTQNGDIAESINSDFAISADEWLQAFKSYGGAVGKYQTFDMAFYNLNDDLENMTERDRKTERDVLLRRIVNDYYSIDTVRIAFENLSLGDSPTYQLPEAKGRVTYTKDSPTLVENKRITQRIEVAMTNLDNLDKVFTESYPYVDKPVRGLGFGDESFIHNTEAEAYYDPNTHRIVIGQGTLSSAVNDYGTVNSFTVSQASGKYFDAVSHEFGHSLHHAFVNTLHFTRDPKYSTILSNYEDILNAEDFSWSGNQKTSTMQAVSVYGNYSRAEAFAEAFSLYTTGAEPTIGIQYFDRFKGFMKEMGLEKYHGINQFVGGKSPTNLKVIEKTLAPTAPKKKRSENDATSFTINGKGYFMPISATSRKRGYLVKRVDGYDYTIDIDTGSVLSKKQVKR